MKDDKTTLGDVYEVFSLLRKIYFTQDNQERDFPFNLKYKLTKILFYFQDDGGMIDKKRSELIMELGEDVGNGLYSVKQENADEFRKRFSEMTSTAHLGDMSFPRLTLQEMNDIAAIAPALSGTEVLIADKFLLEK